MAQLNGTVSLTGGLDATKHDSNWYKRCFKCLLLDDHRTFTDRCEREVVTERVIVQ